jgi:hypothetical protein
VDVERLLSYRATSVQGRLQALSIPLRGCPCEARRKRSGGNLSAKSALSALAENRLPTEIEKKGITRR